MLSEVWKNVAKEKKISSCITADINNFPDDFDRENSDYPDEKNSNE